MEQMQFATVIVACNTNGCENQNIDLEVRVFYPSGIVMCGPCSNEIAFTMPNRPEEAPLGDPE